MGRIKQTYLKRIADELIETYGGEFGVEFEVNKKKVSEYCTAEGKSIRNKIAGYITRVMKNKAAAKT